MQLIITDAWLARSRGIQVTIPKLGQKIAEVGSTGRSIGPHLHFQVGVQGIVQDPQKFLAAGKNSPLRQIARAAAVSSSAVH